MADTSPNERAHLSIKRDKERTMKDVRAKLLLNKLAKFEFFKCCISIHSYGYFYTLIT